MPYRPTLPASIRRQMDRFSSRDFRVLEAEVAAKRRRWLDDNLAGLGLSEPVSPRTAYELLFREYMGLPLSELPVVSESATEIAWLSRNPCPTLEACITLGLDTRTVCRAVYEKSTQAFLSRLDPQLRFLRNYDHIRPHAEHCRERIVKVDFQAMMRIALDEARDSLAEGNKGYGAVVTLGDAIIAREHDTATTEGDPSKHGEFKALLAAVDRLDSPDLSGVILFSTCEPCPMCTGLAVWMNVTAIVYGASIADTSQMGKSRILVPAAYIAERSPRLVEVYGGVLRPDCEGLYAGTAR